MHRFRLVICGGVAAAMFSLWLFSDIVRAGEIRADVQHAVSVADADTRIPVIVSVSVDRQAPGDLAIASQETSSARHRHRRWLHMRKQRSLPARSRLRSFLQHRGAVVGDDLWLIDAMVVHATPATIKSLARQADVRDVRLDGTLTIPDVEVLDAAPVEWNVQMMNAPALWDLGFTGQNVVVAAMDSGVDAAHADLGPAWRGGTNSWYDPHGQHSTPYDADGHGTQVMSLMVGADASGTSIGVAPGAQWIAVKLFNDAGQTFYSDIHLGFQWLLDPDDDPNTDDAPDIVNNSWGFKDNPDLCLMEFYDDITALKAAGIAVVFSAGNGGPTASTSISPANYDHVLSVGSVTSTMTVASSSARGPSACTGAVFPLITAPGSAVKAADLTAGGLFPTETTVVSGTSFAAPHVAGAMAVLLSAFPDLTVGQLETIVQGSAVDLGDAGPDNQYGFGLMDMAAAYVMADTMCPADFDGNFQVDLTDLQILAAQWLRNDCLLTGGCTGDLNGDSQVDLLDLAQFAAQYDHVMCP